MGLKYGSPSSFKTPFSKVKIRPIMGLKLTCLMEFKRKFKVKIRPIMGLK